MAARSRPVALAHGHGHGVSHRTDSVIEDHAMDTALPLSSPTRPTSSASSLSSTTSSRANPPSSNITVTVRPPSPSLAERILIPDPSTPSPTSDADLLADLLHSKFSHMSLERPDAPSLMDVFGSGLDRVSIRHLLPTHASLVKSALESTNLEYCTAIVTRVRKYLSMDRVPDAVDNVLALGILRRFADLLVFDDVPAPLKYEVCWVLTNVAAGSSAQTRELAATPGLVGALVRLVGASEMNRDVRVQALWCLGNIVGDGDQLKALVVREGGVQAAARFAGERVINHADVQDAQDDEDEEGEEDLNPTARIVAWFASNVSRGIRSADDWPAIQPLVPILHSLLTWPDTDTLVDAAWGLARVLQPIDHMHDLDTPPASPATAEMTHQLVHLLSLAAHDSVSSSTAIRLRSPALRALTNLSTATDAWHIQLLVDAGAVPVLYELVRSGTPALVGLPRWDAASPRAFAKDKVPGYMAKDAMLVLANMVACADLDVVGGMLESAPLVKLWYAVLVAGLVPQAAPTAPPPAFSTRSMRSSAAATAAAAVGIDVAIVREAAWAVSNLTTCRDPLVMDYLTRHVDVGDDWRQVLIAGIGAGTAAPADVLGLGVQMGLLVPRAGAAHRCAAAKCAPIGKARRGDQKTAWRGCKWPVK
ncbi:armadillo-type protein [Catenaria anguillulae PL171]|uniref:Armadillo-type protein n=1 Tax=Catenaria anguillulae PL171 TaxID=765915 RepID=A0A1Y2HMH0_9FUNG|nr:armadillo-type protein [Catenaria anguillulae PL171]